MQATRPHVAVIVPVAGDPAPLGRLLKSISQVEWPAERRQLVVVVDGPDAELEALARKNDATTVVLPTNQGSYAARNAGIDALHPDVSVVAFTDSDCVVSPGWLDAHTRALTACDLSGGAVDVSLRDRPSAAEWVDKVRHLHQERYVTQDGYAATANLAVRREVLDTLRFDGSLRSSGDDEFGTRARALGFQLAYTPDAIVEHPARRNDAAVMTKMRRICGGIEDNPAKWEHRQVPRARFSLHLARLARQAGVARGPVWQLHTSLLQYRADLAVQHAVERARREQGW